MNKKWKIGSLQQHVDIWVMERHQGQLPTPSAHPYALQDHTHLKGAGDFSKEEYNVSCGEYAGTQLYKTSETDFTASKKRLNTVTLKGL
jgi:hypothetical protein